MFNGTQRIHIYFRYEQESNHLKLNSPYSYFTDKP